ncbi:class I SAM-dependent rRNA methyltransferase [uncultured Sanguibacteroides sp.]|uniref:class I SAM-dependent rRNA methyltransferase n=1 Tax=uncultured Sanguibacteroides sp. TaxID=1635151 RepID=UPI0025E87A4C|nr:class I SAM-dependent rRNA methyltransferase [uncultured Sanguibacteroides sp.]
MNKIILKAGKERSLFRLHPWIFSGAIAKITNDLQEGDVVEVYNHDQEFMCIGHYQIGSIAVRVLSFEQREINYSFWKERIQQAYNTRITIGLAQAPDNNVYRLIHGEGDDLPGLIVDFYAGVAVVQFHSVGMYKVRREIAKAIVEVMGDQLSAIYDKSEGTLPFKAGLNPRNEYLYGESENFIAIENGLKFNVDWLEGQKTGFFVDQRENRSLLEKYAKGKNVLNMFCYTGGFSFYAMRGGARTVHSVDASARAIELTNRNVELNFPGDPRHEAFVEDAFKFLEKSEHKYDLIILDPPAFAKHQNVLGNAIQGYKKLNRKGIEVVKPGGLIFTFSCSQVMTKELFRQTVFTAAANTGRKVKILHQLTQPADHPINIYHPEGEYLKGLVLYVE